MQPEGFRKFKIHHHTDLWKARDAKSDGKGFGVSISGAWYWYEPWVDIVHQYCRDSGDRFT
jgi:hypothetical protein